MKNIKLILSILLFSSLIPAITYDDACAILGIARDSTIEVIKKAYRKKSLLFHPDRNPGKIAWATAQMTQLNNARDLLLNKNIPDFVPQGFSTPDFFAEEFARKFAEETERLNKIRRNSLIWQGTILAGCAAYVGWHYYYTLRAPIVHIGTEIVVRYQDVLSQVTTLLRANNNWSYLTRTQVYFDSKEHAWPYYHTALENAIEEALYRYHAKKMSYAETPEFKEFYEATPRFLKFFKKERHATRLLAWAKQQISLEELKQLYPVTIDEEMLKKKMSLTVMI